MTPAQKVRRLAVVPIAMLAACLATTPASAHRGSPGAADVGDYLFPGLGNGGYDARHYTLALRYPTASPLQPRIHGVVRMRAVATQTLSRFNLDFAGDDVSAVLVNGRRADFRREAEDLVITPRKRLKRWRGFTTDVVFTTHNYVPDPDDAIPFGWFTTVDGSVTAFQPNVAHFSYPVNDHPSDKATYSFFVDVPSGVDVATNGVRTGRRSFADRTLWSFEERNPMASELVQVTTGDLAVIDRGRAAGVPIRDVTSKASAAIVEPALARTPTHMRWMVDRVGRYPFENYGVLSADQFFLYALETQTLSLHATLFFDPSVLPGLTGEPWFYEPIMVHELAHQWFGDSVAPERWSDVWLNEGHATWYEFEWSEQAGEIDENGFASFEDYMEAQYALGDQLRHDFGPVAHPTHNDLFGLFSANVYGGGALVLYALQQEVGNATFRAIERGWAQRKRGQSVGTEDFIRFASRVAGRDLGPFLRDWLFGETTPEMPGHPDWEVDPVQVPAPAAKVADPLSIRGVELRGRGGMSLKRY